MTGGKLGLKGFIQIIKTSINWVPILTGEKSGDQDINMYIKPRLFLSSNLYRM